MTTLHVALGVKSDAILYRYSYPWLFRLMAEEGVQHLQLGTFFEMYQLPDSFFHRLRAQAADHGIAISSVFTAHRELGGYFQGDEWVGVARRNHERLIEIAGMLGARSAGSNPGAVLRDRIGTKSLGLTTYVNQMQELMHYAHAQGVSELTVEPMSCEAEPPCSPQEQLDLMEVLTAYHQAHSNTAAPGYCIDIAHGWAGLDRKVKVDHWGLLEAGLPWCRELHLKNADSIYEKTFGFSDAEIKKGIIDIAACRHWLEQRADQLPVNELVGYLEIAGPKLGRDYSDMELGPMLRDSLRHLKASWLKPTDAISTNIPSELHVVTSAPTVRIAPSLMCADQCHLEDEVRRMEASGCDVLHFDIMDGHFAPNLVLGFEQLRQLRPRTKLPIDVHLMVEDNDLFVKLAHAAGADWVSVHVESCIHLDRTLANIRQLGMKAGVALNPATPIESLYFVLNRLDYVLLMTVNPGFAGQQLVPSAMTKIRETKEFLAKHNVNIPIEVDGNVSFINIPAMVAAGADILVAGSSSVFAKNASLDENVCRVRKEIAQGLSQRNLADVMEAAL
jgi:ribulose-phosphate 3-epimerase